MRTKFVPVFLLFITAVIPQSAYAREYSIRTIAGTVESKGWEQSLIKETPNLFHWHWEPVRDNIQKLDRVATGPGTHLAVKNAPLTSQAEPKQKDVQPYIVLHPAVEKKPYITLVATEKKTYISLPTEQKPKAPYITQMESKPKAPYITPTQNKPRGPYITPTQKKPKGPYISLPDQKAEKTTYIKLYEPLKRDEYIQLNGKLIPERHNPYNQTTPPPLIAAENLRGKLTPSKEPIESTASLTGKLTPTGIKEEQSAPRRHVVERQQVAQRVAVYTAQTAINPDDADMVAAYAHTSFLNNSAEAVQARLVAARHESSNRHSSHQSR